MFTTQLIIVCSTFVFKSIKIFIISFALQDKDTFVGALNLILEFAEEMKKETKETQDRYT